MTDIISTAPSLTPSGKRPFIERAHKAPLKALNLPDGFTGLTIDGIKPPLVRDVVYKYGMNFIPATEGGIGIFLAGKSGAYKTYSVCVLAEAIYNLFKITVDFFDCAKEFPMIDRQWYEGYAQRRLNEVNSAPFLIVDDFSQLRQNTRDLVVLQEIVNVRYNAKLPTFYTANITFSSTDFTPLETLVGVQTSRRIRERSSGFMAVIES